MRIREIGKTLHLIRYAGYDKEGKKPMEAKIGAVGTFCLPIVLENDAPTNSDEGIPKSLWRKLTIEEQEKLLEELTARQVRLKRVGFQLAASRLQECVTNVDAVTPELAAALWEHMAELQKALKKAGHPKPHLSEKTPQKAAIDAVDTRTAQLPLEN